MKLALVQMDLAWERVEENHRRARNLLELAKERGAALVLLPEMFSTGFSMDSGRIAQDPEGPSATFLRETAHQLGLHLLASVPIAGEPAPRNTAILASPTGTLTRYAKIHPFSFSGEDRAYAAGERVVTVEVDGVRVTPFVCYDLRFPEPFRLAAEETDLFAVVANWPRERIGHWSLLLRARAVENLAFVAGVNRVGEGGKLQYPGASAVISPLGETLVEGGEEESVLVCEVDSKAVAEARERFPFLRDRRPQAYRR